MYSPAVFYSFTILISLVPKIHSACVSYGTDYVDGGTYCINTALTDYFSFATQFFGCQASDSQGDITPILVDPNNDEYFCSDIPTTPDGTPFASTCNVAGNEVTKNNMLSGTWTVVIEGLTFAYMRSFNLVAGPPVVVTSTPVLTFTVTSTSTTTTKTTATVTNTSTLKAATVTTPSTTIVKTSTYIAPPTTTTSTLFITKNVLNRVFSASTKTVTATTNCRTLAPAKDRILNFTPTKTPAAKARRSEGKRSGPVLARPEIGARALLEKRTGDLCTTTVLATANLPSTTVTATAPVVTVPSIIYSTVTTTSTPVPVTVFVGLTVVTVTTTKPILIITIPAVAVTTITAQTTIVATVTSTVQVPPSGAACLKY